MLRVFNPSEERRLRELTKNNSRRLSKIVNLTRESLNRLPLLARKAIVDDVALILKNAEKFSPSDLARSSRLCPDMLLPDLRAPLSSENVRLVMMASYGSMNGALRGFEDPGDVLVILNCLRYLASQTNDTLLPDDLSVLNNPRFLRYPTVVNSIKALKPVLDKAARLDSTVWQRAAQVLLTKGKAIEIWCLNNALALTPSSEQKHKIFRYICQHYIESGDLDALKLFLLTRHYGEEIAHWGESDSLDASVWMTVLLASHEVGVTLGCTERALLFAHYVQKGPSPEIREELFDNLETVSALRAKGLITPQLLPIFKGLISQGAYLGVVFDSYIAATDVKTRLDYFYMLENAVDKKPQLQTELRRLCLSDDTGGLEAVFLEDIARTGNLKFLLKVFPAQLYSATLLKLARQLFSSSVGDKEVFIYELIVACNTATKNGEHSAVLGTDSELFKLARNYLIETAQFDRGARAGLTLEGDLHQYFNHHTVSDHQLVFFATSLLRLTHSDALDNFAESRYGIELAQFLAKRMLFRLAASDTSSPELPGIASKLCRLGKCQDTLVQAYYPDWDPARPLPAVIVNMLTTQPRLSAPEVMGFVGKLHIENVVRRKAYTVALLETRLLGHDGHHIKRAVLPGEEIECAACYDNLVEGDTVFQLDEKCKGTLCQECVGGSVNTLKNNNQCQWDCECKIHSNTAIAFGANLEAILSARQATVMKHLATVSDWDHWNQCQDSDCIGVKPSILESSKRQGDVECVLCHQASPVKTEAEIKADIDTVKMHLDFLGSMPSSGRLNGNGIIRECFDCGKSVQKDDQCASVTCSPDEGHDGANGCGAKFDFVGGTKGGAGNREHYYYHYNQFPAQEYIPGRASVLWQAGFYSEERGCEPSTRNPKLMETLIAGKDDWFKAYKEIALADLEKHKASAAEKPDEKEKPTLAMPLGSIKYPKASETSKENFTRTFLADDLVSYQENGTWHIGTVKKLSEQFDRLTVMGRDGRSRDYSIDTPMIQAPGFVPIMPRTFLPREPIEYRASAVTEPLDSSWKFGGTDWRLGRVEKTDESGVWVKVAENQAPVLLPRDNNILAPAGTHHRVKNT